MIRVDVLGVEAAIDGYKWTCKEPMLQNILNAMLDPFGPSGSDPNPDLNAARDSVSRLGGKIIDEGPKPSYSPDRVY